MTQTFIDTIVVCSITGFVIVATGAWTQHDPETGAAFTGAPLTTVAFSTRPAGKWGGGIVAIGARALRVLHHPGLEEVLTARRGHRVPDRGQVDPPLSVLFFVAGLLLRGWVLSPSDEHQRASSWSGTSLTL